jgi:transcriptional regulator with XRE-family HTH domain
MTFGERLRDARKAKNLTLEQLGVGLGTDGKDATKAVVWGWEKGQHFPRVDQLALICARLKCNAHFLLFGEGQAGAESLPADAMGLAERLDGIKAPRVRAAAENAAMAAITRVVAASDPLSSGALGISLSPETQPETRQPDGQASPRTQPTTQAGPGER